ncbi:MAG: DEAD/DEAH box helicase [Chitinophagaceae bacterium]|nr:DEAD/DEAH box helicase [Chitinophagaceae bacterium]
MTTTFSDLGLHENIVSAITELGFETPTEIQQKAIPVFIERTSDLVALAQTGTGKTAAFGLPILHHLDTEKKFTQALIISPTRELCIQITNDLKKYSKNMRGVRITAVYGGSSISEQIRELRQGVHIIVATPGRLIDLIDRKAVKIEQVETVVLDEADEMLNMGFQEDIESILSNTPEDKVTGLFSATMPKAIRSIANKYLKETVEVSSGKKNSTSADITHQYAVVQAKEKLPALKRIIDFNEDFFGIIFCTTRLETQEISDSLVKSGYNADCLHGDLSQQQRDKVMGKFRKRVIKILCATDVAARGIDVNDITHVIHYHLPDDIENYTHRSGRTARAGKKGISIALLHIREAYKMHQIEKIANMKFEKFMIPKGEEIIDKRIKNFVTEFAEFDYQNTSEIQPRNEWIFPLMQMDKEELVARIMAKELSKLDTNYTAHSDLNVDESSRSKGSDRGSDRGERGERRGSDRGDRRGNERSSDRGERGSRRDSFADGEPTTRLFINLGKKDNLRYDEMREMIFQNSKVSGHHIKDIEMQGVFSFFETDAQSAERILTGFKNVEVNGREVRITRAEGEQNSGGRTAERSERKGPRERTYTSARGGNNTVGGDRKYGSSARSGSGSSSSRGGSSASSAPKPRFKKRNDDTSW